MSKIFVLIFLSLLSFNILNSQPKIPNQLIGKWESLQFKIARQDSLDERIISGTSPQIITIDSTGKCFIQLLSEGVNWEGKLISVKYSDSEFEVKFGAKKAYLYIKSIKNNPNYFFLTFQDTFTSIPFTRYKLKTSLIMK